MKTIYEERILVHRIEGERRPFGNKNVTKKGFHSL